MNRLRKPRNLSSLPLFVALLTTPCRAFDLRLNNTFDTWYGSLRIDKAGKQDTGVVAEDILSVRAFQSNLRASLDLLHTSYWDQEFAIRDTDVTQLYTILWKQIELETPAVTAALGDFYSTFGQGLILGMERDQQLQRERLIQGVRVEARSPWVEVCQIYGAPRVINRVQKKHEILNDTTDRLFGVEVSIPLLMRYGVLLSGRGLRLQMADTVYTNLSGGGIEFNHAWVNWYLEVAQKSGWERLSRESMVRFVERKGKGWYSSLDIVPLGVNIQYIDYDTLGTGGFECRYDLIPTLNQSGYRIDDGTYGKHLTRTATGFQVSAERAIRDVIISVSHSQIGAKDTATVREKKKKILDWHSKVEFLDFDGSVEYLALDGSVDPHFVERTKIEGQIHGSVKHVEGTLFLSCNEVVIPTTDSTVNFHDIGTSIEFPVLNILSIYSNYTKRSEEIIDDCPGIEWYGVGLKIEPSPRLLFEIWGGKEKGGFVCTGGTCRWVAPFDGVKAKVVLTL